MFVIYCNGRVQPTKSVIASDKYCKLSTRRYNGLGGSEKTHRYRLEISFCRALQLQRLVEDYYDIGRILWPPRVRVDFHIPSPRHLAIETGSPSGRVLREERDIDFGRLSERSLAGPRLRISCREYTNIIEVKL